MKFHTWTYPWDVASIGVENALSELQELGMQGIDLATNYHSITSLSPRNQQRRLFSTEQGGVFFPARAERYKTIKPSLWPDPDVLAVWPRIADRIDSYGLDLHSWTIGLFQPWIAQQVPECARVYPTGDINQTGICPANPHVREFLAAMCSDVAQMFPVRMIQLEGVSFPKYDYGWIRPRLLLHLSPWSEKLLGLCFCKSCIGRARQRGVDGESLRQRVATEIEKSFTAAGDFDDDRTIEERGGAWMKDNPDIHEFWRSAEDAAIELVRLIAEAVSEVSATCRVSVWGPADVDGSPGANLERLLDVLGGITTIKLKNSPNHAAAVRSLKAANASIQITHLQGCSAPSLGWPYDIESPDIVDDLTAAIALPVDRISFYNYGLLRESQFKRLVKMAKNLRGKQTGA